MENIGINPWLVCLGVFCIWPLLFLGIGYYWGKYGAPVTINLPHLRREERFDDYS